MGTRIHTVDFLFTNMKSNANFTFHARQVKTNLITQLWNSNSNKTLNLANNKLWLIFSCFCMKCEFCIERYIHKQKTAVSDGVLPFVIPGPYFLN